MAAYKDATEKFAAVVKKINEISGIKVFALKFDSTERVCVLIGTTKKSMTVYCFDLTGKSLWTPFTITSLNDINGAVLIDNYFIYSATESSANRGYIFKVYDMSSGTAPTTPLKSSSLNNYLVLIYFACKDNSSNYWITASSNSSKETVVSYNITTGTVTRTEGSHRLEGVYIYYKYISGNTWNGIFWNNDSNDTLYHPVLSLETSLAGDKTSKMMDTTRTIYNYERLPHTYAVYMFPIFNYTNSWDDLGKEVFGTIYNGDTLTHKLWLCSIVPYGYAYPYLFYGKYKIPVGFTSPDNTAYAYNVQSYYPLNIDGECMIVYNTSTQNVEIVNWSDKLASINDIYKMSSRYDTAITAGYSDARTFYNNYPDGESTWVVSSKTYRMEDCNLTLLDHNAAASYSTCVNNEDVSSALSVNYSDDMSDLCIPSFNYSLTSQGYRYLEDNNKWAPILSEIDFASYLLPINIACIDKDVSTLSTASGNQSTASFFLPYTELLLVRDFSSWASNFYVYADSTNNRTVSTYYTQLMYFYDAKLYLPNVGAFMSANCDKSLLISPKCIVNNVSNNIITTATYATRISDATFNANTYYLNGNVLTKVTPKNYVAVQRGNLTLDTLYYNIVLDIPLNLNQYNTLSSIINGSITAYINGLAFSISWSTGAGTCTKYTSGSNYYAKYTLSNLQLLTGFGGVVGVGTTTFTISCTATSYNTTPTYATTNVIATRLNIKYSANASSDYNNILFTCGTRSA